MKIRRSAIAIFLFLFLLTLTLLKLEYSWLVPLDTNRFFSMSVRQLLANTNEMHGRKNKDGRLFLNLKEMFGLNDFHFLNKSIDPRPEYEFLINPWIHKNNTQNAQVNWSMVVIIESPPENGHRRQAVRETWASAQARSIVNIVAVFIVGTRNNKTFQKSLVQENEQYGDILQMDKEDIYRHVTHKSLAAIQWTSTNFAAHWIYALSGDDVYLDVLKFRDEIELMIKESRKELKNIYPKDNVTHKQVLRELPIYCSYRLYDRNPPIRRQNNKYYVSESEYPYNYYPPYCAGPFYAMPIHKAAALLEKARYLDYCWMEDAWVTGVVRLVEQTENGVLLLEDEKNVFEIGIRESRINSPVIHISELNVDDIVKYIKECWKKIQHV